MVEVYRVKGSFGERMDKQVFTIDVLATKPEDAKEKIYANVGSKHRVKRRLIRIESVETIPANETKSLVVKQLTEAK